MFQTVFKVVLATLFFSVLALAKESLVVSILPQKTLLDAIVGDKIATEVMVGSGQNPHTYEPKPSQMSSLANAKIYFSIGIEFEEVWLPKFADLNKKMAIVNSSKGIEKIPMVGHKHEEDHDHDHEEHHDHEHGSLDPHVWLTPQNAKIIAKNMYDKVLLIDKENATFYKNNYETLIVKLDALDSEIKKKLSHLPPHSKFMVFHPSWGYFAKDYNLLQLPVEVEGKSPKAKDIANLIEQAKNSEVKVIFAQPEFTQKFADIIAKEGGIEVVSISPLSPDLFKTLDSFADALSKSYK